MAEDSIQSAKSKFQETVEHFSEELKKLRTGRANPAMLDGITVEAYGQNLPLIQVANTTTLDAQTLQISPFDPNNLEAISAAIRDDQTLGLNPSDDGRVVRVSIPPMTTERREQVVKQLRERVEEANISLRNVRQDIMKSLKQEQKSGDISEDEFKRLEKQLTDELDRARATIEQHAKTKEDEIMTV